MWASRWQDVKLVDSSELTEQLNDRASQYCMTNRFADADQAETPRVPPEIDIVADKTSGHRPLLVNFSADVTGKVDEFSWDFGDGKTSSQRNQLHTFSRIGVFRVRLTGTAGDDTISDEIQISTVVIPKQME